MQVGPKYGFGDVGHDGVPPGSSLEVLIELLKVKAVKTVDPDHLGLITKIIEKDGAAYNTPNDYSEVLVSWDGFLADDTKFDQVRHLNFKYAGRLGIIVAAAQTRKYAVHDVC